ncbi:MAG: DUF222 domain-containing protein [Actinomycetes bacterium]
MCSTVERGSVAEQLAAARVAVAGLVASARDGGLDQMPHDELAGLLREVRTLQARLEFVTLTTVRQVDARGSYVADGALSTAAWTRQTARLPPWEAAETVRAARALAGGALPATGAALADGLIDPAHVRAIADAVTDAPPDAVALIEPEALAVAAEADPRAVAAVMRRFRHALDPDTADQAALARYARRGLTLAPLPDGAVHLAGLADEVTGAVLMTAIDTASPLVPGDRRTCAQRRLDALTDICRSYLAAPSTTTGGGGRRHVLVTIDHQSLRGECQGGSGSHAGAGSQAGAVGHAGAGPGGMLSWVGPIAGSTARRIACDADVTLVLIDPDGHATAEKRERRFFTPAQRRAMIARDGDRCPAPFCDRPITWSDAHHLTPWAAGGPTTADNSARPKSIPLGSQHPEHKNRLVGAALAALGPVLRTT